MKYLLAFALLAIALASASTVKLLRSEQCHDGIECPGGCCPYEGWYCCPDGMYCAATAADCPFVAKKQALSKIAANKQCEGTDCPGGCCPMVDWFCCMDGLYCAEFAVDCLFSSKKQTLPKLAAKKLLRSEQCDCCECPGGCCPFVGWFCCPDNLHCAPTADDC